MSYTRSFTRRVSIPYRGSVSVSYPASQSGGTTTAYYSGTAHEDVTVNVEVNTEPFDESVANTNQHVNLLTGAVAATEAAEIAAIEMSSKKVADTIISGFFGLIRSDISQQVMELSKSVESHLIHLKELGKRCIDKKRQMEADYNRLAKNYTKIFGDLNSELSHRIHELNKPAFMFRNDCVDQTDRMRKDDMISTVSVFGTEESALQVQIQASFIKKRAADTIEAANRFLVKQKTTADTIDSCMINTQVEGGRYVPICYFESVGEKNLLQRDVFQPQGHTVSDPRPLIDQLKNVGWKKMDSDNRATITRFFNQEIATQFNSPDEHNKRVRDTLIKLYNNNTLI